MPPEYLRTNYRLTGEKLDIPKALQSIIVQNSVAVLSSVGYFFDSTGGYGAPSLMFFRGLSIPDQSPSCKGDVDDSTIEWWGGFGVGSFSGSVFFVTALVAHYESGDTVTISALNAVDAYDTATPSTSISAKILWRAIIGSR